MGTKPSVFVDGDQSTLVMASYLNDLRTLCYELAGDGTNAPSTVAQVRTNLGAAKTGVNTDITSLASGLVLAGAPAAADSSLAVPTTGWVQAELTKENALLYNASFAVVMAAGACTISLKTSSGGDPSAADPVRIGYRSSVASGDFFTLTITAPVSVTIPSGATLGTVSNKVSRVWVLGIISGGSFALGVQQCLYDDGAGNLEIVPLGTAATSIKAADLLTATAISTGADANLVYATLSYTTKPFVVLGCFDSKQVTAGVWTASPDAVMLNPSFRPGDVRSYQRNVSSTVESSGSAVIPDDTSIPAAGEGFVLTTLSSSANIYPACGPDLIFTEAVLKLSTAGAGIVISYLAPTGGDAVTASRTQVAGASGVEHMLSYLERRNGWLGGTKSLVIGAATAIVVTFNGAGGASKLGGVLASYVSTKCLSV